MRVLILLPQSSALLLLGVSLLNARQFTPVIDVNKTDVLLLRNGTELIAEFMELDRGIVTLGTDAAGTVYVKWPRVVIATTDKSFQAYMQDGRSFVGSLRSSDNAYRVIIRGERDTLEVKMIRLKSSFWDWVDGSTLAPVGLTSARWGGFSTGAGCSTRRSPIGVQAF